MSIFTGSAVALVTPFTDDQSINYLALERLLDLHLENSTDAIVLLGTTGESATITEKEFEEVLSFTSQHLKGHCPLIVGTGSNSTQKSIHLSCLAEKYKVDGLLIVTPYYNKGNEQGLYEHYKAIHQAVKTPIILYNVPSRTGVNLSISNVVKLSQLDNIVAIKDASGDLNYTKSIIEHTPKDFFVYSGNDDLTIDIMKLGGAGVISVLANLMPKEMHDLCRAMTAYDLNAAQSLWSKMSILNDLMYIEVNPIPVKKALDLMGYQTNVLRLPLYPLHQRYTRQLEQALTNAQLL